VDGERKFESEAIVADFKSELIPNHLQSQIRKSPSFIREEDFL
jgi:hypothetical protein